MYQTMRCIVTVRAPDQILCRYHRIPFQHRVYLGVGLEKTFGEAKHHGDCLQVVPVNKQRNSKTGEDRISGEPGVGADQK